MERMYFTKHDEIWKHDGATANTKSYKVGVSGRERQLDFAFSTIARSIQLG